MDQPYDLDVVVCPECGSEFQLHVTHCIDCGTPTRAAWSFADRLRQGPAQRAFALPREARAAVLRTSGWETAEDLRLFLEERGIRCRLESAEPAGKLSRYAVWVAEEELDGAREAERELLLLQVPDLATAPTELPTLDRCPACASHVSLDCAECPSCGLALNGPPEP